ncbi:lytic transglycosylase [Nocardia sp. NPDC059246]|uniref:lytic transglycosylase domain-containing protein n=1 Tax=unclassified Nocardia TaxID=2637762 RepID=UPI003685B8A9
MLALAGLLVAGSSAVGSSKSTDITTLPAAVAQPAAAAPIPVSDPSVGLVPAAVPEPLRPHTAQVAPASPAHIDFTALAAGQPSVPDLPAVRGIPEIALAAYRNAELRLAESQPNCGLTWDLLAGIGRIESNHANGGATDASGTTLSPIFGPALDGTLPGNEIIGNAAGGYVRAEGPMQFLPSTWRAYADRSADPNNVFDAALAAGRYLCSGGLDLRDPAQKLRAVLRYNNSTAYASNVLSWASIYRTGGADAGAFAGLVPSPEPADSVTPASPTPAPTESAPTDSPEATPTPEATPVPQPSQPMITIPGLPPIPCGIFCPPPAAPDQEPAPAPDPAS